MEKLNKYILIIAIISIIVAIISIKSCSNKSYQLSDLKNNIIFKDSVKQINWTDELGKEHNRVKTLEGDIEIMKITQAKLLDSISRILKIKIENINSVQKEAIIVHDQINIPTLSTPLFYSNGCDTFKQTFFYQDEYSIFLGKIYKGNTFLDYTIYDTLLAVNYTKKTGFLGLNKETFTDYSTTNKNVKLKGLKDLKMTKVETPISFGLIAGVGISSKIEPQIFIGVGFQYKINFKKSKSY